MARLVAGLPLPPRDNYEDLPQQENGVGSIRAFLEALDAATVRPLISAQRGFPKTGVGPRCSWVVVQSLRCCWDLISVPQAGVAACG